MNARKTVLPLLFALVSISCGSSDVPQEEGVRPELSGAARVTGSLLDADGNLPSLYLEYITVADESSQRLAIYRNGLVTLTLERGGRTADKKILFPAEAVTEYETYFSAEMLSQIQQSRLHSSPTRARETVRIYQEDGTRAERSFDSSLVLPGELERQRTMLRDLVQLIFEDRELSNPFHDYTPRKGDLLLDPSMRGWKVLRWFPANETLEVSDPNGSRKIYINLDQIDEMFVGFERPGARD